MRGRSIDACHKKTKCITKGLFHEAIINNWSSLLNCSICGLRFEPPVWVRPCNEGYAHIVCIEFGDITKPFHRYER